MKSILITGGSGFFGEILKEKLLDSGFHCVNIDLVKDQMSHPNLFSVQGDIRNIETLAQIFSQYKFEAVFHCAAILAHAVKDEKFLWSSNVDGTRNIAEFAKRYNVPKVIFISSNCLWAKNFNRPVKENDVPEPAEIYGRSKLEGEKILLDYTDYFDVIIIRTPTIMDCGRLGLLAILFEFIDEGRKIWVVGRGDNKYQFVYARDLTDACLRSLTYDKSDIFHIGSDNVKSLKDVYSHVIAKANSKSKIAHLPRKLTLLLMKIAYFMKVSPLGPYHYKMIAEDFIFDTSRIKDRLGWKPTVTNEEMLFLAYNYYHENREEIKNRQKASAHKQAARMGIIKLLKWL